MESLSERARRLQAEGVFLGGPAVFFEVAGRKVLMALLNEGLTPQSKVLDIGCGCLRVGYWLIHFLNEGCYFGIEPNREMLEAGMRVLLEPGVAEYKEPRFDDNADFNFEVFDQEFDFFVARSIWTHAPKTAIQTMLDQFVRTASRDAVLMTSYVRSTWFQADYQGGEWVGRSHESKARGAVRHSLSWIRRECAERGLVAKEVREPAYDFGYQVWLAVRRAC